MLFIVLLPLGLLSRAEAWEPNKPVEFIIMAGQGGGADKYARLIAGLVDKHNLAPVPLVPINKVGGAGAVAQLESHFIPFRSTERQQKGGFTR